MALLDLFSSPYLFIVAIIILVGVVYFYMNMRMAVQDHKLNSMLGLITTMATELQYFRSKLGSNSSSLPNQTNDESFNNNNNNNNIKNIELIEVSDDDDEDYETEDDDEDQDDEDDQDDTNLLPNINILEQPLAEEEIEDLDTNKIKTIHLETPIELTNESTNLELMLDSELVTNIELESVDQMEPIEDKDDNISLKNIVMDSVGELEETHKTDYRKMSLNQLKKIVVSDGLVSDASKLKKGDLIKLIENRLVENGI